jgi:NitT/TauT family transport system permease protein
MADAVARQPRRGFSQRVPGSMKKTLWSLASAATALVLWSAIVLLVKPPAYILPAPWDVLARAWTDRAALIYQGGMTMSEILIGIGLGIVIAVPLGIVIVAIPVVERLFYPIVVGFNAIPKVALAPLFVVWFGLGLLPKVIICALIVVFPIIITTQTGLRSIERDLIEASWTMGGTRWQTLRYVETPLALGSVLGGVKMGITLAMTGAVVGEFVAASAGLGYLMNFGRSLYNAPMVFAAALTIATAAMLGYAAVSVLQHLLIDWE